MYYNNNKIIFDQQMSSKWIERNNINSKVIQIVIVDFKTKSDQNINKIVYKHIKKS